MYTFIAQWDWMSHLIKVTNFDNSDNFNGDKKKKFILRVDANHEQDFVWKFHKKWIFFK